MPGVGFRGARRSVRSVRAERRLPPRETAPPRDTSEHSSMRTGCAGVVTERAGATIGRRQWPAGRYPQYPVAPISHIMSSKACLTALRASIFSCDRIEGASCWMKRNAHVSGTMRSAASIRRISSAPGNLPRCSVRARCKTLSRMIIRRRPPLKAFSAAGQIKVHTPGPRETLPNPRTHPRATCRTLQYRAQDLTHLCLHRASVLCSTDAQRRFELLIEITNRQGRHRLLLAHCYHCSQR